MCVNMANVPYKFWLACAVVASCVIHTSLCDVWICGNLCCLMLMLLCHVLNTHHPNMHTCRLFE